MSLLDDVSIVVTPNGYKAGRLYGVLPVPTEGSEEITNGGFDTDSDWTKGTGWTISGGTANCDGSQSGNTDLTQIISTSIGKQYKITYTVSNYSAGSIKIRLNSGNVSLSKSSNGTFTEVLSGQGGGFSFRADLDFIGSIDNVSVKEYTASDMSVTRATAATRVDENGLVNYAEVLGSELVTNGDYSSGDAGWSTSSGWTFNNIDASFDGLAYQPIRQDVGLVTGKIYKITFTLNISSGNMFFQLGGGSTSYTTSDTYTIYEEATSHATLSAFISIFSTISSVFTIDNVSVKQADLNNVPRIDYTGGGCPHILSEPQRTNLLPYSSDFSSWDNQNTTISSNLVTSPDGTENASEILETAGSGNHGRYYTLYSVSGGTDYSVSMFVKKLNRRYFGLQSWYSAVRGAIAFFDLDTGTLLYEFAEGTDYTVNNSKIEDYGNGWYKISTIFQIPTSTDLYVGFVLADTEWTTGTSYDNPYTGDITKGAYIWGAQVEVGSYSTSYIPTSGSTVTRNQDQFTRDGISSLINSTEGVLFAEMAALSDDLTYRMISLSDGTVDNSINIQYSGVSNVIRTRVENGGLPQADITYTILNPKSFSKIAVLYKLNKFELWFNGSKVGEDTSGTPPTGLSKLGFDRGDGGSTFFGKVKQLQVYDITLTDNQLIQLTGEAGTHFFESYSEMAETLTYTIQ